MLLLKNCTKKLDNTYINDIQAIDIKDLVKIFKRALELWNYDVFIENSSDWKNEIKKEYSNSFIKMKYDIPKNLNIN